MGRSSTTVVERQESTQTPQATPEEREFNQLRLGQLREFDPLQRQINQLGGSLVSQLLAGQQLPGALAPLTAGIGPQQTQELTDEALRDLNVQLAKSGAGTFLESGASQAIGARTAGDIRRNVAESNLNRQLNLLNLAIGAPAQIQSPALTTAGQLGQSLAGLRSIRTTGTGSQTQTNPFITGNQIMSGIGTGIGVFGALGGFGSPFLAASGATGALGRRN